jgi:spermidine/putrescine transport system permease protein
VPADPLPTGACTQLLLAGLLVAPALLWLFGLIVLPHVDLALLSLRARVAPGEYEPSLAQYQTFVDEPLYWHTFVRTAVLSILATAVTLLLAFPLAWTIAKIARGRTRAMMFVLCLIPFWVSETVRTLGWMILLRESGVLPAFLVQLGSPQRRSSCSTATAPCWSAWSTPRCCSWWCR